MRKLWLLALCFIPLTTGCTHDQVCQWLYDHGQMDSKITTCVHVDPTEYTPVNIP